MTDNIDIQLFPFQAVVDILKELRWRNVAVLSETTDHSSDLVDQLLQVAGRQRICVTETVHVNNAGENATFNDVILSLVKNVQKGK